MITFTNLTKRYRRDCDALRDVNLSIEPGSVFALMGRNGAGKTTAIHMLLDLVRPTAGEACLFGVPSPRLRPEHRQRLGYVSENQQLPEWMRLGAFLNYLKPMYPTWDDAMRARLVKLFALPLDKKLGQLSRGQRMKAAFLGALCYRPEVLILDEPFSGLDSVIRQDLLDALVDFLTDGRHTVLLSSHDLEEVERLADSIGILENGRLTLSSKVDDLLATAREVVFTTSGTTLPPALPGKWWNLVTSPLGSTFTATAVADEAVLAASVKRHWPDATGLIIRPTGLRRLYVDFLRRTQSRQPISTSLLS